MSYRKDSVAEVPLEPPKGSSGGSEGWNEPISTSPSFTKTGAFPASRLRSICYMFTDFTAWQK